MTENNIPQKSCPIAPWRHGICAILAALALGLCIVWAVNTLKSYDRTVSVRGLCEREVMADRAIYPVVYKETGDNLSQLYADVKNKNQIVVDYLKQNGFDDSEINVSAPKLTDNYSNGYSSQAPTRYVMTSVVNLYTTKVKQALKLQESISSLMDQGIAIGSGNDWENVAEFMFEGLNDIKPQMIKEANDNARMAGDQFASDSHSSLGKIKEATQGLFSVENRDSNTPYIKRVRVVTNVTFYLK